MTTARHCRVCGHFYRFGHDCISPSKRHKRNIDRASLAMLVASMAVLVGMFVYFGV